MTLQSPVDQTRHSRLHRFIEGWIPRTNLAWFALIFACWILVDISLMRWLSKYAFVVAAPLAMAVFLRPNNARLFVAMVAASLWAWWLKMPFVVNVVIVGAFFSIVILIATGVHLVRHRRMPTMAEIEQQIFPIFRVGVPVVWLFAVLHKTNWDFLNPDISCAVQHYHLLRKHLSFLPPESNPIVGHGAVWTAWCFEFSVPILLLLGMVPRFSRKFLIAGTFLAFGFHFVMSVNGYQNFSLLGMAFYIPFMPKNLWRSAAAGIARLYRRWGRAFRALFIVAMVGVLAFGVEMFLFSVGQVINQSVRWPLEGKPARFQGWLITTFLFCPIFMLGWTWLNWRRRGRVYETVQGRLPVWSYVVLGLVVFNGLCPYLGLKTENSFAMFSNLLTESQRWNHVFLPPSMQVFHYQDQMVTVHRVTVPGQELAKLKKRDDALGKLAQLTDEKFQIVPFEFRRLTAQASHQSPGPIEIEYEINGSRFHVTDARMDPNLNTGNPYWQKKLMMFRWVPNSPHGICLH